VAQNSHSTPIALVMYSVLTPILNPFIQILRNKDIKRALKKLFDMDSNKVPIMLSLKKCSCLQDLKALGQTWGSWIRWWK
jgi:hypothetical protein